MNLRLTVIAGPDAGRTFELESGQELLVGRGDKSDLRLGDPSVSRVHLKIGHAGETITISDQGSSSGTFIDGNKITESNVEPLEMSSSLVTREYGSIKMALPEKTVAPSARPPAAMEVKPLFQLIGTELGPYKLTEIIGKGKLGNGL